MSIVAWHGRIGSGGFGEVHKASLVKNGPVFAVKLLLKQPVNQEIAVRRFHREVGMQQRLTHPNVMEIVALGLDDDPPWYAMPLAEQDLAAAIQAQAGDDGFIIDAFGQVLRGVQAAHVHGIVHRDLKPNNILDVGKGTWAVSDFGAGLELDRETTVITHAQGIGTLDYLSPEQYSDPHNADRRCDVFSLGKILLQMVTGQQPMPFRPQHIPGGQFGPLIDKATQQDPAHRYQSVDEFIAAFDAATTAGSFEAPTQQLARLEEELGQPDASDATVDKVLDLLVRYPDRQEFHHQLVPRISMDLMKSLRLRREDSFRTLIERYDGHVSGGLDFGYCDIVADFYSDLIVTFPDIDLFRKLFARLLEMGASHNRWHVMGVVFSICSTASLEHVPVIAAAITADPWSSERTFIDRDVIELAPEIQAALVSLRP